LDKKAKRKHQKELVRKRKRKILKLYGYPSPSRKTSLELTVEDVAKRAGLM